MIPLRTAIGILLLASPLVAQSPTDQQQARGRARPDTNDAIPFAPLELPSFFWVGWPRHSLYEADVRFPAHLWSRTGNLQRPDAAHDPFANCSPAWVSSVVARLPFHRRVQPANRGTGCSVTLLPHFVLRQADNGSAPVATPTFNPQLVFKWHSWDWIGAEQSPRGKLSTFSVTLGHYSNGQSGCSFSNQAFDRVTEECVDTLLARAPLNTTDGSFSTHYLEFGSSTATLAFGPSGRERRLAVLFGGVRMNVPAEILKGGLDADIARRYGGLSFFSYYQLRWRGADGRSARQLKFEGECGYYRPSPNLPCRGSVEASWGFARLYGFGIAAKYVTGWDYYNISFEEHLANPRAKGPVLGFVFDHSVPVTLAR